jgi:hypothetical protein
MRNAYKILIGTPEGRRPHNKDLGVYGRILNWVLRTQGWRVWIGLIWLRTETGGTCTHAGSCEHGNEPSGSIKDREFLDS